MLCGASAADSRARSGGTALRQRKDHRAGDNFGSGRGEVHGGRYHHDKPASAGHCGDGVRRSACGFRLPAANLLRESNRRAVRSGDLLRREADRCTGDDSFPGKRHDAGFRRAYYRGVCRLAAFTGADNPGIRQGAAEYCLSPWKRRPAPTGIPAWWKQALSLLCRSFLPL